jgi:hypothetical protein
LFTEDYIQTFDLIISTIGFGKYHLKVYLLSLLLFLIIGSDSINNVLILPRIQNNWPHTFISFYLISWVSIFKMVGELLAFFFLDKFGRRIPALIGLF